MPVLLKNLLALPRKCGTNLNGFHVFAPLLIGTVIGFTISFLTMTYFLESDITSPLNMVDRHTEVIDIQKGALYDDVRVLCWVMTNPTNHWTKAQFVKRTWGRRCNILLFMSTAEGKLFEENQFCDDNKIETFM